MPLFELSGSFLRCWHCRRHYVGLEVVFCPFSFFVFWFFFFLLSPKPQRVQSLANKIFYAGFICHIKSMSFAAATTQKAGPTDNALLTVHSAPNLHHHPAKIHTSQDQIHPSTRHCSSSRSGRNINKNHAPKIQQKNIPKVTDTLTPALEFMRESNSPKGTTLKELNNEGKAGGRD